MILAYLWGMPQLGKWHCFQGDSDLSLCRVWRRAEMSQFWIEQASIPQWSCKTCVRKSSTMQVREMLAAREVQAS